MPQDIRLWGIQADGKLLQIDQGMLNNEKQLEDWLEEDIDILSDELLVIGRQVGTAYGGFIDLLCMNPAGDLVIVELKRDKTPREITAQALDYASWVADLSHDDVTELANTYLHLRGQGTLEEAFRKKFDSDLPDVLNENQEMLIVGSVIDASSERIMKFLSGKHDVAINAATFQHFTTKDAKELLARTFLMAPADVKKPKGKLTYEQLCGIADEHGVRELFEEAGDKLYALFDSKGTTTSTQSFKKRVEGSQETVFHLVPKDSDTTVGVRFVFYAERLAQHLGVAKDKLLSEFPLKVETQSSQFLGGATEGVGFIRNAQELDSVVQVLGKLRAEQAKK